MVDLMRRGCWLMFILGMIGVCPAESRPRGTEEEVVDKIDACALLSTPAIQQALKREIGEPQRMDSGYVDSGAYSSSCLWMVTLGPRVPASKRHLVILHAMRWPRGMAKTFLEQFYTAASNGELPRQPVPRKIGDDALWWGDGVAVRKGDVSFGVSVLVQGISLKESGRIEEGLAQQVLKKVGSGLH